MPRFFVPQRILCYHHVMRFRKILIGLFLLLFSLPLFADYRILLPDKDRDDFIVASKDGDTIALDTDCSHRRACGVLVDRLAPCPYTILRLWDYGCRPEHLNCRPSTPLSTLAAGFCLFSRERQSAPPYYIHLLAVSSVSPP